MNTVLLSTRTTQDVVRIILVHKHIPAINGWVDYNTRTGQRKQVMPRAFLVDKTNLAIVAAYDRVTKCIEAVAYDPIKYITHSKT